MHIYMQHPIAASAQLAFLAKPELLIPPPPVYTAHSRSYCKSTIGHGIEFVFNVVLMV